MEDKKDTRDGKDSSSSSEYETESEAVAKAPKEDNTPNEEPDDAEDKEKSSSSSSEYETDGNASDSDAPKTRKRMQEGSVMGSTIGGGWDLDSYSLVPVNISFSNLFYRYPFELSNSPRANLNFLSAACILAKDSNN